MALATVFTALEEAVAGAVGAAAIAQHVQVKMVHKHHAHDPRLWHLLWQAIIATMPCCVAAVENYYPNLPPNRSCPALQALSLRPVHY